MSVESNFSDCCGFAITMLNVIGGVYLKRVYCIIRYGKVTALSS